MARQSKYLREVRERARVADRGPTTQALASASLELECVGSACGGATRMGDKGKKDKGKRESQKEAKLGLKDKRKRKKEKKQK
jgi:hypothetical protein